MKRYYLVDKKTGKRTGGWTKTLEFAKRVLKPGERIEKRQTKLV